MFTPISILGLLITVGAALAMPSAAAAGAKKVFAHYMLGNAYFMGVADFQKDIALAQAAGIDGFALNVGPDTWMPDRCDKMYQAAAGTSFRLFVSLDMAVLAGANISQLTHWVTDYKAHPNQYFYKRRQFVSTFAGESLTFGQSSPAAGWQLFKSTLASLGANIFFVPAFTALGPTAALSFPSNDGAFSWNAWPTTNSSMTTAEDDAYMSARNGKVYMAGVSPWFFTHFSYKNFIYKSDDLYTTRWEQMVAVQPDFVEIITWNDYGESHYIGPVDGATPYDGTIDSSQWVTGYNHTAWLGLTAYYIRAYKSGSFPAVRQNKLWMWYRTYPKSAVAAADPYGKPMRWDYDDDNIYIVVMLTAPATVNVTSGGSTQSFAGKPGVVNKFQFVGFQPGTPTVTVTAASGKVLLSRSGPKEIGTAPTIYNFNPVVASWGFGSKGEEVDC